MRKRTLSYLLSSRIRLWVLVASFEPNFAISSDSVLNVVVEGEATGVVTDCFLDIAYEMGCTVSSDEGVVKLKVDWLRCLINSGLDSLLNFFNEVFKVG